jgi:dTDP-L-rhamnose 4-epimerase
LERFRQSEPLVVITGGAGFIGCALSQRFMREGATVVAVDNLHPQVHPSRIRPPALPADVALVQRDVTDGVTWDELLQDVRPNILVHLAAETGTGQSLFEASRHGQVNVLGTTVMIDALLRHQAVPRHVVLASSRAVYGEGLWRTEAGDRFYPLPRDHAQLEAGRWDCVGANGSPARGVPSKASVTSPAPTSVYGATKLAQEHILRAWCLATGADLSILRLHNVYGPGQSLANSYTGIVALFSRLAREKKPIPLYEDGKVVRDFVYIDDVAEALYGACVKPPIGGFRLLDIGSGVESTIGHLASTLVDYYGGPPPIVTGRFRDGDVRYAACDLSDTLTSLDWAPTTSLKDGIAALQEWIARYEVRASGGIG